MASLATGGALNGIAGTGAKVNGIAAPGRLNGIAGTGGALNGSQALAPK